MTCPACGETAPLDAKFCIACGAWLGRTAAECAHTRPSEARFCPECGAGVRARADEGTVAQVSNVAGASRTAGDDLEFENALQRHREWTPRHYEEWARRHNEQRVRTTERRITLALTVAVGLPLVATWLLLPADVAVRPVGVDTVPQAPDVTATSARSDSMDGEGDGLPVDQPPRRSASADDTPLKAPALTPEPPEDPRRPSRRGDAASGQRNARAPQEKPVQRDVRLPVSPSGSEASKDRPVAVYVKRQPLEGGLTAYTVQLFEPGGQPSTTATVSLRRRGADGALIESTLEKAEEPGAYRTIVARDNDIADRRLRIAGVGRVQEVPIE